MSMLGIGFTEMILIAGIALVVVGPDKFPDFAKIIIRTVRDLRGYVDEMKDEVTKELAPVRKELKELNKYDAESYIDALTKSDDDSRDELPDTGEDQSGYSYNEDTPGSDHDEGKEDEGFDDYDEYDDYANAYGEYSQGEITGEGEGGVAKSESEEILKEYFGEDQGGEGESAETPSEETPPEDVAETDSEEEIQLPDRLDG